MRVVLSLLSLAGLFTAGLYYFGGSPVVEVTRAAIQESREPGRMHAAPIWLRVRRPVVIRLYAASAFKVPPERQVQTADWKSGCTRSALQNAQQHAHIPP